MKKVFAILLVLALVAGFVFAVDSENHKINLKPVVEGHLPEFQLTYVSGAKTGAAAETNEGEVDFAGGSSYDNDEIEIADLSQEAVTVKFKVVLANSDERIQAKVYNISLTAGRFEVERVKGTNATHGASVATLTTSDLSGSNSVSSNVKYAEWGTVSSSGTATVAGSNGLITSQGEDLVRSADLTFDASAQSAAADAVLAEFEVTYPQDKTIIPNADSENHTTDGYKATITMVVSAN